MIFRNLLLKALSADDRGHLFPHMLETALQTGQTVHEQGEPVWAVYFPSSAVLSSVVVMEDGANIEIGTTGYEGGAGLLPGLTGTTSGSRVFAQIAGMAVRIGVEGFRAAAEASPGLLNLLLRATQATAAQAEQSVACNALHDAEARLARWLLLTEDRVGAPTFPLTQDYLAIMVGVQRTTISAIASVLKARSLIHYSRGVMEIRDRPGLEKVACECYRAVMNRQIDLGLPVREGGWVES